MRFVPWYPLAEAAAHAPSAPGVFQVRIRRGLIDYPRGKSAMIHYGAAPVVRAAIAEFLAEHPSADWLCRHAIELSAWEARHPEAACQALVKRFRARFGAPPTVPP